MAAISTLILSLCRSGDEIVSTPALYGGTYRFFRDILPDHNINVKYVNPASPEDLIYLITPKTRVVYLETPTNPTLDIIDIRRIVALTRKVERELRKSVTVVTDNTFATILNQNPFSLGVNVIVESSTKYLAGMRI